jgi:hypothetical protein
MNALRIRLLALMLYFLPVHILANETPPFDYSTTWRIIYFQGNSQFVNQRPLDYNPDQGFIAIFELLNKYVGNMHPFGAEVSDEKIESLGIWAQLYLINDATYQELSLGDHVLSDGKGWVTMANEDYEKLSRLLIDRKDKKGDHFDGDKEQALKKLLWIDNGQDPIEKFDAQYHSASQPAASDNPGSRKPSENTPYKTESPRQSSTSIEASEPTAETLMNNINTRQENNSGISASQNTNPQSGPAKKSPVQASDPQSIRQFMYGGFAVAVIAFLALFNRRKKNR